MNDNKKENFNNTILLNKSDSINIKNQNQEKENKNEEVDKLNCAKKKEDFYLNFSKVTRQKLNKEIIFTYDVNFELSEVSMSSRWDHYLDLNEDNIHWYNLINYFVIILIISAIIVYIFLRSVKRDIDIYNTVKLIIIILLNKIIILIY
jgi:hypothetical protein